MLDDVSFRPADIGLRKFGYVWSSLIKDPPKHTVASRIKTEFIPTELTSVSVSVLQNYFQKNPRVGKIFVRNSGAGDGCVDFMDA